MKTPINMSQRNFLSIKVGDEFRYSLAVTAEDVDEFCKLSGDTNPLHLDSAFARDLGYKDRVVYGALSMAYISRVIGVAFPGRGTVWLSQQLRFDSPLYIGDIITICVKVRQKNEALRSLSLGIEITKENKRKVVTGDLVVGIESSLINRDAETPAISGEALVTVPALGTHEEPTRELVAIVTGGGRGIGAAISSTLAGRGIRVVVNYLSNHTAADATIDRIRTSGGKAIAVASDVSAPEGAKSLFQRAMEEFERVDIIVNNAGPVVLKKELGELTVDILNRHFSSYVGSSFELSRLAFEGMKARGFGRIVNVLTSAILGPPPVGWIPYIVAKSALEGLSRSLAVELGPAGITCNMVSPSLVPTDLWSQLSENQLRALALRNPTRRLASVKDVAATVAFLASPESQHINGVNIPVTGGETML
jgi:3-oxoacyl-[acyl-carrier protein] reductase